MFSMLSLMHIYLDMTHIDLDLMHIYLPRPCLASITGDLQLRIKPCGNKSWQESLGKRYENGVQGGCDMVMGWGVCMEGC